MISNNTLAMTKLSISVGKRTNLLKNAFTKLIS